MRKLFLIGCGMFCLLFSCEDGGLETEDPVEILSPIDDLVRLQAISVTGTSNAGDQDIAIIYDNQNRISEILFSGLRTATYQMNYAANNQLSQFTVLENDAMTSSTITYDGNMATVSSSFPDGRVQEQELELDSQNRVDLIKIFDVDGMNNRTAVDQISYEFTQNFNISRIDNLTPSGNTVESFKEFTYVFNKNPFQDMNDLIRLLIFADFIPSARYLPTTQIDRERIGGSFVVSQSLSYEYNLLENEFPGSREVTVSSASGTETRLETFIYQE